MGTKIGDVKSKAGTVIVRHFVKDIKANGLCFVRSRSIVDKLLEADSDLNIVYDNEEECFIATYPGKKKL